MRAPPAMLPSLPNTGRMSTVCPRFSRGRPLLRDPGDREMGRPGSANVSTRRFAAFTAEFVATEEINGRSGAHAKFFGPWAVAARCPHPAAAWTRPQSLRMVNTLVARSWRLRWSRGAARVLFPWNLDRNSAPPAVDPRADADRAPQPAEFAWVGLGHIQPGTQVFSCSSPQPAGAVRVPDFGQRNRQLWRVLLLRSLSAQALGELVVRALMLAEASARRGVKGLRLFPSPLSC